MIVHMLSINVEDIGSIRKFIDSCSRKSIALICIGGLQGLPFHFF